MKDENLKNDLTELEMLWLREMHGWPMRLMIPSVELHGMHQWAVGDKRWDDEVLAQSDCTYCQEARA